MPQSYRSHRSSGLGYGDLTELTKIPGTVRGGVTELLEVPGILARAYRTHIISYKHDIPIPRVFVALAYRTYRSSGYGYECRRERPEVPGTGMYECPTTELIEVVCKGNNTPGGYGLYIPYRTTQPWKLTWW